MLPVSNKIRKIARWFLTKRPLAYEKLRDIPKAIGDYLVYGAGGKRIKLHNDNFRNKRIEKGFVTMAMLSKFTNISMNALYAYEAAKALPSFKHSQMLSEALESDITDLFPTISQKIILRLREVRSKELSFMKGISALTSQPQAWPLLKHQPIVIREVIDSILTTLNDRERKVIELRFLCEEKNTYRSIGREMGITGTAVQQIKKKAISKLRHPTRSRILVALSRMCP